MAVRSASMLLPVAVVMAIGEGSSQFVRFRDFDDDNCTKGGSWVGFQPGMCNPQADGTSTKYLCQSTGVLLSIFPDNNCQNASSSSMVNFTQDSSCQHSLMATCVDSPRESTQLVPFRDFDDDTCTAGGLQTLLKVGYCLPKDDGTGGSVMFGCSPNGVSLQDFKTGDCSDSMFNLVEFPNSSSCVYSLKAGACFEPSPIPTNTFFVRSSYEGPDCKSNIVQERTIYPSGYCYPDPTGARWMKTWCQNSSVVTSFYSDLACASFSNALVMDGFCYNDSEVPRLLTCLDTALNQPVTRSKYTTSACTGPMVEEVVMQVGCTEAKQYNANSRTWSPGSIRVTLEGSNITYQEFSSSDCSGVVVQGAFVQGECGSCVSFRNDSYRVNCLAPVPAPTLAPVLTPTLAPVLTPTLAPVLTPTLAPAPTLAPVPRTAQAENRTSAAFLPVPSLPTAMTVAVAAILAQ